MKRESAKIISILFGILSVIMLGCAVFSAYVCHESIAAQLAQGATVKGNELAIVNIYLSACAQYVAFAALLFFCGWLARALFQRGVAAPKPAASEAPAAPESDEDFLKWASEEPEQKE